MNGYVYNCIILRFRPYRDIGEFVNIGVAISYPKLNRFCFKIDNRIRRIKNFFPEIDKTLIKNGKEYIKCEFKKFFPTTTPASDEQECFDFITRDCNNAFQYIASIKEGAFIFSEVICGITTKPDFLLDELFDFYIERNFKKEAPYLDQQLEIELKNTFQSFKLNNILREGRIGSEQYSLKVPFFGEGIAIKPLFLDRKNSTDIYEHGDLWTGKISRLKKTLGNFPLFLCPIKEPSTAIARNRSAYIEIKEQLEDLSVKVINFDDKRKIINLIHQNLKNLSE